MSFVLGIVVILKTFFDDQLYQIMNQKSIIALSLRSKNKVIGMTSNQPDIIVASLSLIISLIISPIFLRKLTLDNAKVSFFTDFKVLWNQSILKMLILSLLQCQVVGDIWSGFDYLSLFV